ncbi:MerR family transcriptional regulator [Streptomyces sp. NBC_01481]|uniref:MerR family transcriptional regulator n=1 Tax=Streptomyces sp. NBC_01481 TaxID=2975869 RepID=UPI00225A2488|nr:MerR family transcriptional regulator [Streptomyces sp. NBC_01481]MCX4582495.1 MerR family transcriptional regulator [Streptomyces sp. NBC_01481]
MRISELSRRSGVATATIKYYLREGLLPPGRATAATQAEYGESHVQRLRLIRALIGVRGLTVSAAKDVLDALSEVETDTHELLGLVFGVWPASGAKDSAAKDSAKDGDPDSDTSEVNALLAEMGWTVTEHNPARHVITQTLDTLRSLGMDYDWQNLVPYAQLAEKTAALDLDQLQDPAEPIEKAERAVLLTFLLEPALLALRRLAQEAESTVRYRG